MLFLIDLKLCINYFTDLLLKMNCLKFIYKINILIRLLINDIMMAGDLCLSCGLEVEEDNEALVCAICDNVQHRLCSVLVYQSKKMWGRC